jgi:hypothetical protein
MRIVPGYPWLGRYMSVLMHSRNCGEGVVYQVIFQTHIVGDTSWRIVDSLGLFYVTWVDSCTVYKWDAHVITFAYRVSSVLY